MEQVKYAVESGALRAGDQLPGIRPLAEELVINANTVAKAYRELERAGVIELRQGAGAFVADRASVQQTINKKFRGAQPLVADTVTMLRARGFRDDEIRRLFEGELAGFRKAGGQSD